MKMGTQLANTLPNDIRRVAHVNLLKRFRFRENLVFDQNQDMGYLWYDFKQSHFTTI